MDISWALLENSIRSPSPLASKTQYWLEHHKGALRSHKSSLLHPGLLKCVAGEVSAVWRRGRGGEGGPPTAALQQSILQPAAARLQPPPPVTGSLALTNQRPGVDKATNQRGDCSTSLQSPSIPPHCSRSSVNIIAVLCWWEIYQNRNI